ncbi:L10-interacting MYB domain-containing protein-like [Neltuma alba]|uniref:L10-interacting MYB domain-containing protein-like n=1 Tax=Neltuma alba TaxID=207710 RepID=UPI0010A396F4|nr:L10-interacting MYB domain-containing protein-like [Prosopis alba]
MNKEKSKATWDTSTTEVLLKECMEQIYRKNRQGTSFSKTGWNNIHSAFNAKTGKSYEKKQLKNRLDSLRKDWRTWVDLNKETGVGWDPVNNTVVATNEWWEKKKLENPQYEKFRYQGLKFAYELNTIFKGVIASGEDMLAPSLTQPQTQEDDEENVYRVDTELLEGSGDSKEDLGGASVGVTNEMAGVNLTANTTPSGSGSHGKRKRGEGSSRQTKQKLPASRQIADSVSEIATASKDRAATLKKIKEVSISEVTAEVLCLEEITSDSDFRNRCLRLLLHKSVREMVVSLKGQPEYLVAWLQDMAYNPPSWLKPPPA